MFIVKTAKCHRNVPYPGCTGTATTAARCNTPEPSIAGLSSLQLQWASTAVSGLKNSLWPQEQSLASRTVSWLQEQCPGSKNSVLASRTVSWPQEQCPGLSILLASVYSWRYTPLGSPWTGLKRSYCSVRAVLVTGVVRVTGSARVRYSGWVGRGSTQPVPS